MLGGIVIQGIVFQVSMSSCYHRAVCQGLQHIEYMVHTYYNHAIARYSDPYVYRKMTALNFQNQIVWIACRFWETLEESLA